jgi:DNA repair protein RadD
LARREIHYADLVIIDQCHLQFEAIRQLMADPGWGYVPVLRLIATPWSKGLGRVYQWLIQPVSILDLIDRAI